MKASKPESRGRRHEGLRRFARVFFTAVPVNYLWELAQSPLYLPASRLSEMWWHCFVASLGDGLIIGIIYGVCATVFCERDWYVRMTLPRWAVLLSANFALGALVEGVGLRLHRWSYADTMPLIPGLALGLVPIVQMLVLPPLVFWLCRVCTSPSQCCR